MPPPSWKASSDRASSARLQANRDSARRSLRPCSPVPSVIARSGPMTRLSGTASLTANRVRWSAPWGLFRVSRRWPSTAAPQRAAPRQKTAEFAPRPATKQGCGRDEREHLGPAGRRSIRIASWPKHLPPYPAARDWSPFFSELHRPRGDEIDAPHDAVRAGCSNRREAFT